MEKVSLEVAQNEFERWAEAMDLDIDPSGMDEEDKKGFELAKGKLIRALGNGSLVITDSGEAVFTPQRPGSNWGDNPPLTFHERSGADMMGMDGKKDTQQYKKMFSALGGICKVSPSTFSKLTGSDLAVCESIFVLLMA